MSENMNLVSRIALAAAIAAGGQVIAQSQDQPMLEEIVVTAERRAANLQDVPVAVQVVTGDTISQKAVTNLSGIQNLVPSLVITDNTGFFVPYIRGVGSLTVGQGTYASVATYVDGVYIARQTSGTFDLDNVESIQVLSGPQGSLYGRNATAGALVVTTNTARPGDEFSGKFSATLGNYNNRVVNGRLMGSLSDTAAISLSGQMQQRDGFIENLNPDGVGLHQEDLDDRDSMNLSAAVSFEFNDRVSGVVRGSHFKSDDRYASGYQAVGQEEFPADFGGLLNANQGALAGVGIGLLTPAYVAGAEAATIGADQATIDAAIAAAIAQAQADAFALGGSAVFSERFGATYDTLVTGDVPGGVLEGIGKKLGTALFIEVSSLSLALDFELDAFTAKSISSYVKNEYAGSTSIGAEGPGLGYDAAVAPGVSVFVPFDGSIGFTGDFPTETYSQEFTIDSPTDSDIVWTAGSMYFKEEGKTDLTGDFFGASLWTARNDWEADSLAVYAQATYPINDFWSVTGGARYTEEEFSIDDRLDPADPLTLPGLPNVDLDPQEDDTTTYTARIQRDAGDWLVYLGSTSGFKSGTLNVNNPVAGSADPEEVTSYELGFKSDISDQLRLNLAAYYYDYEAVQLTLIDDSSGANFLANGAEAEVYGLDLEILYALSADLSIRLTATALDTEYLSDATLATGATLETSGKNLVGAADLAANLSVDWSLPLNFDGELAAGFDYGYNSGYFYDAENLIGTGGGDDDAYGVANLSLRYLAPDEAIELVLWGKNIFDEEYYRSGIAAAGGLAQLGIAANPATYGLTASYSF